MKNATSSFAVVIPNWSGARMIVNTLESLKKQRLGATVIVVDNGSTDDSLAILEPMAAANELLLIKRDHNYGFTGGVNPGIQYALGNNYEGVALLNNDAVAEPEWLSSLADALHANPNIGIVACKQLDGEGVTIDSTGELFSIWGLAYPRGRGEADTGQYDSDHRIFGASGGATLYRCDMLKQIGLFDQDFFAYYEDVDISLRARLAGWEVYFEPRAVVRHAANQTSSRVKGFTTYQTLKNLPWVLIKNIPFPLLARMYPRFLVAYFAFFGKALVSGRGWPALKGFLMSVWRLPKKLWQRRHIQASRKIAASELEALILRDLPPDAHGLRALRHKLGGKP